MKSGAYWWNKLTTNQARDQTVTRTLRRAGWRVLRVWEHELARKRQDKLVAQIRDFLGG